MAEIEWGDWTVVSTKKVVKKLTPGEMKKVKGGSMRNASVNCRVTESRRCAQICSKTKVGRKWTSTCTDDPGNCQSSQSVNCS